MRVQGIKTPAILLAFTCVLGAQTQVSTDRPVAPGQPASQRDIAAPAIPAARISVSGASYGVDPDESAPSTSIASVPDSKHDTRINRIWVGSIVAMLAATSFDAATSMGKYESNSLLASSNGKFGERGIAIKAGVAAAVLAPQILLIRKHRDLRSKFAIANFIQAGIFSGVAVHNLGIAAPKN